MPDIVNLEQDVNQIKLELKAISTKVAVVENDLKYTATKGDVSQLEAKMGHSMRNLIMWVESSIIAMTGIAFAIARYVK